MDQYDNPLNMVVEGDLDEVVMRRLFSHAGCVAGSVHGKRGKGYIRNKISDFHHAARYAKWLVLVDLDQEYDCAPELVDGWLPGGLGGLGLRVAVRAVESWLLADRERVASFLGVRDSAIPVDPDSLIDPKLTIINLARQSSRREIREGIVPTSGGRRTIGTDYNALLAEFVTGRRNSWRPNVAIRRSESLRRCVGDLHRLQRT